MYYVLYIDTLADTIIRVLESVFFVFIKFFYVIADKIN